MGSYLEFADKENNSKSISYPMSTIIREVLPGKENPNKYIHGWILKRKHVAALAMFTTNLLADDDVLETYIMSHKEEYGFNNDFGTIKERIREIHNIFTTTLIEMVLDKRKRIEAIWV